MKWLRFKRVSSGLTVSTGTLIQCNYAVSFEGSFQPELFWLAWIAQTSYKIFYLGLYLNSTCCWSTESGYTLDRFGLTIESCGQRMAMLYLVSMLEQVLSTLAIRAVESVHSPVRTSILEWMMFCSDKLPGVLSDATKSVSRAYINNFQDKGKQIAIDMFLVSCH